MNAARQLKPFRGARLNRTHTLAQGLVGCWVFNEGSGGMVYDLSGYGNHGTLTNMDPATDWVGGKHGWALDFDGDDDAVVLTSNPSIDDLANITISAWIKPDSLGEGNYGRVFDKGTGTAAAKVLYIAAGDNVRWLHCFSSKNGNWGTPPNSITLGAWQHIVLVYNNTSIANDPAIFINGINQTVTEISDPQGSASSESGVNARIGNDSTYVRTFDGVIDDVCIYNRELSEQEIPWLYREPFCMFEEPTPRAIFIMPGSPWWYYQRNKMRRSM